MNENKLRRAIALLTRPAKQLAPDMARCLAASMASGQVERNQVYAGRDARLLDVQQAMVRKIVTELNPFANMYFEVCNVSCEQGRMGVPPVWHGPVAHS